MLTTIRVPVPVTYIHELEQRGGGIPKLGGAHTVTVAGHNLGEWAVQSVEYTMSAESGYTVPVYWVTLGREVGTAP